MNQIQIGNLNLLENNKSPKKLFLLLLLICIILFPKEKMYYSNIKFELVDHLESYTPQYSSLGSLIEFEKNPFLKILNFFKNSTKVIFNDSEVVNEIPTVILDIKFENYKKLLEEREKSIKDDIGTDFTEVNGKISFNGNKMKCKVRLKGDYSDHWRSEKRMSFRINVKGDNSLLNFKRFSLQKPSVRYPPYDQTFQSLQKEMGNISPSQNYVKLVVNGMDWGIMNIEEHMSKEMLEKQKFNESLIIKFGDEKKWRYIRKNSGNLYEDYLLSDPLLNISVYQGTKYLNDSIYRKYFTYLSNEHLKNKTQLYEIDSFSKSLILSLIWNETHTLYGSNSRYYFNPFDLKIYTITTDQLPFSQFTSKLPIPSPYDKIIVDSLFGSNFYKNLSKVEKSLVKSQSIMNKWHSYFPMDELISTNILKENLKRFRSLKELKENIISPIITQKNSNDKKIDTIISKNLFDHIHARHFDNGEIHIYNLLNDKVKLKRISVGGKKIKKFDYKMLDEHNFKYDPLIIKTTLLGLHDNQIEIQTEHDKYERFYTIGYTLLTKNINNPLLKKTKVKKFNFIKTSDSQNHKIIKGEWEVTEPLVLDGGLEIERGTTLTFKNKSYIILNGPLIINGTETENVTLKSNDMWWRGIYVYNSESKSIINHTKFKNLINLSDGLLNLTGGITFYKSDVEMENVNFENCKSEDFLNIIHSKFVLKNVKFENSLSDAFDSDFSSGVISNSTFKNISGDGVDFSASNVKVFNSSFNNIRDKAISVGESSFIEINSISVDDVGVGVSVKDGSIAKIEKSNFSNFSLNALMTYKKKSFYSSPKLSSIDNKFDNIDNCCLRQINSNFINDGVDIRERSFNVDSLYQTKTMKK